MVPTLKQWSKSGRARMPKRLQALLSALRRWGSKRPRWEAMPQAPKASTQVLPLVRRRPTKVALPPVSLSAPAPSRSLERVW